MFVFKLGHRQMIDGGEQISPTSTVATHVKAKEDLILIFQTYKLHGTEKKYRKINIKIFRL